jgi:hypothetical protein
MTAGYNPLQKIAIMLLIDFIFRFITNPGAALQAKHHAFIQL